MLVRSAGRRQQRHTSRLLAASFAQLNLPWLAPAQLRWTASQASTSGTTTPTTTTSISSSPSPLRRDTTRVSSGRAFHRRLATAADPHDSTPSSQVPPAGFSSGFRTAADEHIPFDFSSFSESKGLGRPNEPIILSYATTSSDQLIRVSQGLSGSMKDLLGHLHTALGVGRRDRAEAIIQRLGDQSASHSPELRYAHVVYLQDLLKSIMIHGRDSPQALVLLKDMQRWFEVEVRNKGMQPDADLLIPMMRASIRALDGPRRERTIRRYAELSRELGNDVMDEVLQSEEYDDNEFAILGGATQQYYEDPETIANTPVQSTEAADQQEVRVTEATVDIDEVPEVLETQQKGMGLSGIKKAMDVFQELPSLGPDASPEELRQLAYARQRKLEDTSVDIAIERWKIADEDLRRIGVHTSMQSKPMSALMWQWYQSLLPALELELRDSKKALNTSSATDDRNVYGPYLELLPMKKVAANTILYIMSRAANGKNNMSGKYESASKLSSLTTNLSRTIEAECLAIVARQRPGTKSARGSNSTAKLRKNAVRNLQKEMDRPNTSHKTKAKKSSQVELAQVEWPLTVHAKLGAMLVSKFLESAQLPVTREHPRTKERITQMQPAFLHRMIYQQGKKIGMITPNPALLDKLQSEPVGSLIAKRMPMVVEPKPWKGWKDGGYLHYSNSILRLASGDRSSKDYFMAAHEKQDLDTLYKGLTALGKVPWKVHQGVFNVQLEAWNSGEPIANFAPLNPDIPIPPEPETSADPNERKKWLAEVRELGNRKSGYHSKRCFQNFQLEIARTLLNETLYFPHNIDFRGRAYPIPPYLNHMGADNVRGLLVFAEGKELGENGLRWLKTHLATVAGYDKASIEERVEFTMAHLDDIYDSVRNPLGGRRWWLEAEDAWQTLAACFELTEALDSPDPSKFVSHLPIHQDGTCNGLQHYAALGGDRAGAAQVNLEPSDRPADVYTAVADAVKAEVERDAAEGNPVAQKLHGRITRKCVKQPVMTNVYGVTFFGARLQVRKQLEVLFPEVKRYDAVNVGKMSHYVAVKIFKSLGEMFAGAQAIQSWLGQCADRISTCLTPEQIEQLKSLRKAVGKRTKKSVEAEAAEKAAEAASEVEEVVAKKGRGKKKSGAQDEHSLSKPLFRSTVIWTTPLRLPVVQPYRSTKSKVIPTTMQTLALKDPQVWDPVSRRKQLQAFPPNFIHSLDATHMLLSALKCTENGMTFASIHDSFWTHACDVNRMSEVLRDAFVAMHSEDIIGRLREEFEARYKGCMYMATVLTDSPVGQRIQQHRVDVKQEAKAQKDKTMPSELALENERMRLMNSEDAEERAKGEAMVTPGSIVLAESDTTAFAVATEFAGSKLGEMPINPADVEASADIDGAEADPEAVLEDEADADAEAEAGDVIKAAEGNEDDATPSEQSKDIKTNVKVAPRKLYVWLPLTFPEVPKKGDFDVRRLRQSRYFFH